MKSVLLNEGLETIGKKETISGEICEGNAFWGSGIESIRLPSTVKRLEAMTFCNCHALRSVEISDGLEYIGRECFSNSGVEEVSLPSTLKEIAENAFQKCDSLRTVWVEEGCTVDVRKYVSDNVEVRCK